MSIKWIPLAGNATTSGDHVTFPGGVSAKDAAGQMQHPAALLISNQRFAGGRIRAKMTFQSVDGTVGAGIVILYQPQTKAFLEVQLGGIYLCSVLSFADGRWDSLSSVGYGDHLEANREYDVDIRVQGSVIDVSVDGVNLLTASIPITVPRTQTGLYFRGGAQIDVKAFKVESKKPIAFVVMQFSAPYDELYEQVIAEACKDYSLEPVRADKKFGPGVIIQDIEEQIAEARVVIADITPANLNVYYEVGYAHALKKDTILIAEKPTELPFDVSPFRVLFYEDSIAGKSKVEKGLRKHLDAIIAE